MFNGTLHTVRETDIFNEILKIIYTSLKGPAHPHSCFQLPWLKSQIPSHPSEFPCTYITLYPLKNQMSNTTVRVIMCVSWECRAEQVPGDETGSWQVCEGVDHGDHQRDYHDTGVYDVQLGAEVNFEPKRWLSYTQHETINMLRRKNSPYHATQSICLNLNS